MKKKSQFAQDEFYKVTKPGAALTVVSLSARPGQPTQRSAKRYPLKRGDVLRYMGPADRGIGNRHKFYSASHKLTGTLATPMGRKMTDYLESGNLLHLRSASTLRGKIIRLAHTNPDLRTDLLPLLGKKASPPPRPNLSRPIKVKTRDGEIEITAIKDDEGLGTRTLRGWINDNMGKMAEFVVEMMGGYPGTPSIIQGDMDAYEVESFLTGNLDKLKRYL